MYALVRTPLQVLIGMVGIAAFAFTGELQLVANKSSTKSSALILLWVVASLTVLVVGELGVFWQWISRRNEIAKGAVPYAAIRVRKEALRVRFQRTRVVVPWADVISARSGEEGFELFWRPDRGLVGVHVSPSQSSLLPSGDLPDDEFMAAWINQILADRRMAEHLG